MRRVSNTIAARRLINGSIFSISGRVPMAMEARMAEHDLSPVVRNVAVMADEAIVIGGRRLTIEEVVSIAQRRTPVALSADPAWRARIERGAEFLRRHLAQGATASWVNTLYVDSGRGAVPVDLLQGPPPQTPRHL